MSESAQIEKKWQERWEEAKLFEAEPDDTRRKVFVTVPYPYVNGEPHIGHGFTYMRADAYARFKRMQGFNVLFPQGFHATGEPILGVVERVRNGDRDQIEALKNMGATDEDLEKFASEGPEFVANYWKEKTMEVLRSAGYSVDWRRTFITAITPTYNKFIQWQYNTLKKKGYVVQGTHPVVWCPHDQSPTGDHDRLVGEGEGPIEFVMIKFQNEVGEIFPCATMRPETAYGVTNIWMNPDGQYVRAEVDGEDWILSSRAAHKLEDQLHDVKFKEEIDVKKFIGKKVTNPVTKSEVPILPAYFVNPEIATGVVMSVPSHAPYDWVGLHDLKENEDQARKFGLSLELLDGIVPISIISVEGMSENPAIETVGKMMISDQRDREKLDEATDVVYKKEFHQGVLKANTEYAGMKVSEAKEKLIADFVKRKLGIILWETSAEVVCRCKTRCHIKILENQWFLKFSDEKWKRDVKEAISKMNFYPEIARTQFVNTVDWLKDKACARKSGLGTKLPWDEEWIVETLSDSVIYMAYYTIAHIISSKKIPAEKLTDEVFDYVMLGEGTAKDAAKKSKLDEKIIQSMRAELDYFYPVDMRFSGKDLIQNHLTYYIFHHTAIWDEPMWPRGIAANGYVTLKGQKMSKRFGNVLRFRDLINEYGADVTRLNLVGANENMDDADWREEGVESISARIRMLRNTAREIKSAKRPTNQGIDNFLASRLQKTISEATEACEATRFRTAVQKALFESTNDMKWYMDRCGGLANCNPKTLEKYLSTVVRMLAPFMPHTAEEIWESMGNENFVSASEWPKPDPEMSDEKSELGEDMVRQVMDDVRQIQKISGIVPKKAILIVAPEWKFGVYKTVLAARGKDVKAMMGMLTEKSEDTVKYAQSLHKKSNELRDKFLGRQEQFDLLGEAKSFLEGQLSVKIEIEDAEKSKIDKARNADVRKPAIMLA